MTWKQYASLEWMQPGAFRRSYELRAGETPVGTLEFDSLFGSKATGRAAGSGWTFKRVGFFSPRVTARVEGADTEIALYEPRWSGTKGTVTAPDGEDLYFHASNFWSTEWRLERTSGAVLLELHTRGVLHQSAEVRVRAAGHEREDLPLLVTLCWYVLLLYMADSAGAAVAMG
jgi:hypothetical protein